MQVRVRFGPVRRNPLRIVRVEGAKCRRAPLCGDRACRGREMQVRVRFGCFLELDCCTGESFSELDSKVASL